MNDMRSARFSRSIDASYRTYPSPRVDIARQALAIVLAGGRGSRLSPLTDQRAKPSVPFGGKFRIIDFTLSNCVNSGIRRVGIATQYKAQSLVRHVQRGWSFLDGRFNEFVELLPAQQRVTDDWYKGTADAVYQNLDILRRHDPRVVLILAGDHVYKMDYAGMIEVHLARGAPMTVACTEVPARQASQFGVMEVDCTDRIVGFQEKPARPRLLPGEQDIALGSMGIYAFDTDFLYEQLKKDASDATSDHDFGHTIIPRLIDAGHDVGAYRFSRDPRCLDLEQSAHHSHHSHHPAGRPYWRDVGTIDAYWEANMDLVHVTPALDLYDKTWPIWTCQEQLPPAKFVFDDDQRRGIAADSLVSGGCIVSGSTIKRSLLFSNVRVNSYCQIEDAVLLPNVEVARNVVLRRVVVDKGARIPPGLQVGVDPDADRRRFYVSDNGITVITPAMLDQRDGQP